MEFNLSTAAKDPLVEQLEEQDKKPELSPHYFQSPLEQKETLGGGRPAAGAENTTIAMANIAADRPIETPILPDSAREELKTSSSQHKEDELRAKLTTLMSADIDPEIKRDMAVKEFMAAGQPSSVKEDFLKVLGTKKVAAEAGNPEKQATITDAQRELSNYYKAVELGKAGAYRNIPEAISNLEMVGDTAVAAVAPFTYSPPIVDIITTVMPELSGDTWDKVFVGDLREEFINRANKLPVKEQDALIKSISREIDAYQYLGTDNEYLKKQLQDALLNWRHGGTLDNVLDDMFGVLDLAGTAVGVGGLGKSASKLAARLMKGRKLPDGRYVPDLIAEESRLRVAEDSVLGMAAATDPETARRVAMQALASPEAAKILGIEPENVVLETHLPKALDDKIRPSVSLVDESGFSQVFSDPELAAVKDSIQKTIDTLTAKKAAFAIPSESAFKITDDSIKARYLLSSTEKGDDFDTIAQAKLVATAFESILKRFTFNNTPAVVKVLGYDPKTNGYKPIEDIDAEMLAQKNKRGLRYKISLELEEKLMPSHGLAENPVRSDGLTGHLARWFDKSASFHDWAVRGTNVAFDKFSGQVKAMRQIIKPLFKMSFANQRKVYQLLDAGDREGVWYTLDDLKTFYGSDPDFDKIVEGYNAAVTLQHSIYDKMNTSVRSKLASQGYRELAFEDVLGNETRSVSNVFGQKKLLGRPVDSSELNKIANPINLNKVIDEGQQSSVAKIYDFETDTVRPLNRSDVDLLNAGELQAFKTLRAIRPKNSIDEIEYVLRPTKSRTTRVKELPNEVINRREGYVTRIYDAGYLVVKKSKVRVHGVEEAERTSVAGIESNIADARLLMEQLAAKSDDIKYDLVRSDELRLSTGEDYYDPTSLDWIQDTGHLYTSPRRPKEITGALQNGDEVTDIGKRTVVSISESLLRGIHSAARSGTIEPVINKLVNNWEKSFGDLFGEVSGGKFPWGFNPKAPAKLSILDKKRYDDAVALMDYIKEIAGVGHSRMQAATKNMAIRLSEAVLEGKPGHYRTLLGEGILKARNFNVFDKLKSIAFFQLITMRPLRQAFLQANQMTLYMNRGDYGKYFASGEGAREFTAIWGGMLGKSMGNFETVKATYAKMAGLSLKEYEDTVDAYIRTGLPASIDSHMWVAGSALDRNIHRLADDLAKYPMINDVGAAARLKGNQAHKWIRRMGFDLGEQTQLLGAFLAEKRAFKLANPAEDWKDAYNLGRISGDARTLSGNMNRAGTLAFQKGLIGMTFQFLSHAMKMGQLIIPANNRLAKITGLSKVANKHISDSEKYRMFVTQMLMYGTGGTALTSTYENIRDAYTSTFGEDVPQDVTLAVEEGIFGTMFNMGIRMLRDEKLLSLNDRDIDTTDIEFSKNMSPLGGAPIWSVNNPFSVLLGYIMDTQTRISDLLGPGVETVSRMMEGIPTMYHILGDASYLDTDEKIEAALVNLSTSAFLETDAWFAARYERAVGRYLSRRGNETVKVNNAELLSKTVLGLRSRRAQRATELNLEVTGVYGGYDQEPEASNAALRDRAATDYRHMKRVFHLLGEGAIDIEEMENAMQSMAELNHLGMSERENAVYRTQLWKQHRNDVTKDTQENQMIKNFLRVYKAAPDDPVEDMLSKIRNMPNFEGKEEFVENLEGMFE